MPENYDESVVDELIRSQRNHQRAIDHMVQDRQRMRIAEAEANAYRAALEQIRDMYGRVCEQYEVCEHRSCHDSYSAWAVADKALAEMRAT